MTHTRHLPRDYYQSLEYNKRSNDYRGIVAILDRENPTWSADYEMHFSISENVWILVDKKKAAKPIKFDDFDSGPPW